MVLGEGAAIKPSPYQCCELLQQGCSRKRFFWLWRSFKKCQFSCTNLHSQLYIVGCNPQFQIGHSTYYAVSDIMMCFVLSAGSSKSWTRLRISCCSLACSTTTSPRLLTSVLTSITSTAPASSLTIMLHLQLGTRRFHSTEHCLCLDPVPTALMITMNRSVTITLVVKTAACSMWCA